MPTFKVTPYLGVGADADDVQNGKALGGEQAPLRTLSFA